MRALGVLLLAAVVYQVSGHGFLRDPPNRASMWRFGYDTPVNQHDNRFWCGHFKVMWGNHSGRCGECGDDFADPRPRSNENGGTYGQGIVTKRYRKGQNFTAQAHLTANHLGWFRFSLCPLHSANQLETEECFQQHVLQLADGSGSIYHVQRSERGVFDVELSLPPNLTCERCVLQWHWQGGDRKGTCENGRMRVKGCGKQSVFRSCADIAIEP